MTAKHSALLSGLLISSLTGSVGAATWTVDDDGEADFTTVQAAVDAAADGDLIEVAPGTYTASGDQVVDMLGKAITLRATGSTRNTILDGEGERRVIHCASGETAATRIEGFRIIDGYAEQGAGVYCAASSPTLDRCWILDNEAYAQFFAEGGGVFLSQSSAQIIDCTFADNVVRTLLSWQSQGGAVYCSLSSPQITGCTIIDNACAEAEGTAQGGGIYSSEDSNPLITDTLLCRNGPDQVFGPWTDGGGTEVSESCTWNELHVPADFPTIGSAVALIADANVPYFEIVVAPGRYTGDWPYAVVSTAGQTFTMRSSRGRDVTILDGENTHPIAFCAPTDIDQDPVVVFEGFTLMNGLEWYPSGGGGIYLRDMTLTINDCTITGNTANHASAAGGGILCFDSSTLTVTNCTITDNSAQSGPALSTDASSSTSIADTIICGNGPDQIVGMWTDEGGNCVSVMCEDFDGDGQIDWCRCPGDANGDGLVNTDDILAFLSAWGTDDPDADFNGDGVVDVDDLFVLLAQWGSCD